MQGTLAFREGQTVLHRTAHSGVALLPAWRKQCSCYCGWHTMRGMVCHPKYSGILLRTKPHSILAGMVLSTLR